MLELLLKGVISGALVVAASVVARRSPVAGAILVSLPLTSMLAILWLYADTRDVEQVRAFATSVAWVVLPSIVFFIVLAWGIRAGWEFVPAFAGATVTMVAAYALYGRVLAALGIDA